MKLSQSRSRQTQDQIQSSARSLFAEQGYDATSIEQVAIRAKVAKASVFAHFGDKSNLLAALGLADIEALLASSRVLAAAESPLAPADHLFALFEPWLAYFGRQPAFAKLYLSQTGLSAGPWTERFLEICRGLEDLAAEVIARHLPGCTTERATLLSRGAHALFHETMVFRISNWVEDETAAAALLRQFLDIWMAGAARG